MEKKHSKLGITSTLLAIIIWIYVAVLAFIVVKTDYFSKFLDRYFFSNRGGMVDGMGDFGTAIMVLFFLLVVIPGIGHILGIIFGFVGAFSQTKKRLFGVIGIFANLFPFILGGILYLIGAA